jgi:hypothetical protein
MLWWKLMLCKTNIVCAKTWCATKNDLPDYLVLQHNMHYNTQVINMELYVDLRKSNLNTLISTWALSTRITIGIQLFDICFDSAGELGKGHFFDFFQWQWMQPISHFAIHQTPLRCTKGIAKNIMPTLITMLWNVLIIWHFIQPPSVPCFD